ncbi:hypothetical protein [Absidia glauca]|uniref:RRM domain-containing protein n=1 Tax=Absidia glauca TaxID=4829 RepID=A0A168LMC0_ABSGL|nr:hypothetical protein [Absidia glauca]
MADIPPNQTLYIKNLNSRINVIELKASLYNLFASYGHIVDVKAQSTEKLREQAFVAFVDVTSATTAMRSLEGFVFYDKPLIITYAKNKSDAVALLDGTFKLRTKPTSSANTTALGKRNNDDSTDQPSKQTKMDSDGDDSE